jgi:hypothetical protein
MAKTAKKEAKTDKEAKAEKESKTAKDAKKGKRKPTYMLVNDWDEFMF